MQYNIEKNISFICICFILLYFYAACRQNHVYIYNYYYSSVYMYIFLLNSPCFYFNDLPLYTLMTAFSAVEAPLITIAINIVFITKHQSYFSCNIELHFTSCQMHC